MTVTFAQVAVTFALTVLAWGAVEVAFSWMKRRLDL